jgi:hypothetical protein
MQNFFFIQLLTNFKRIFVSTTIYNAAVCCQIVRFHQFHVNALIYKSIELFPVLACVWKIHEIEGELQAWR